MGAINHITIPNSTLRRFLDTENKIYQLDLSTKEIIEIPVDRYGETPRIMYNTTNKQIFLKEADEYIEREVEGKLGEANHSIDNYINGGRSDFRKPVKKLEEIESKYKDVTIKAIAVQTARNHDFAKKLGLEMISDKKTFEKVVEIYSRKLRHQ